MISDQIILTLLFVSILGMMAWGRIRHDLIAAAGLLIAVALGLVPAPDAFSGFSNEAVIIVALALIVSRALQNSGVLTPLAKLIASGERSLASHIAVTSGIGAALSSVMNNVAALTLLMPFDVETARRTKRPPALTLLPLGFATILGGIVTLIGTPPNIVASAIREARLGHAYRMFDFTPVGIVVALVGVAFVAFIGWRLVPRRTDELQKLAEANSYQAELRVPETSPVVGKISSDLEQDTDLADVTFIGIRRGDRVHYRRSRSMEIQPDDRLLVEGSTDAIGAFMKSAHLNEDSGEDEEEKDKKKDDDKAQKQPARHAEIVEGVVGSESLLVGETPRSLQLLSRYGLRLLGIARRGRMRRSDMRDREFEAGDALLLSGNAVADATSINRLGLIVVNRVRTDSFHPFETAFVGMLFLAAVAAASFGLISFPVALAFAVVCYAAFGIVPARDFYANIEWPIVVMLACLLPIGAAFDRTGGTETIAKAILALTPGQSAVVALIAMMMATTLLSGVLNNVATIVIFAPAAIDMAEKLHVNPDTFLMGVTIAASCSFLTPLGHKNNLLIMGPAGLRFGDYWRLGLPLSAVVLATSVPMLLWVWPL